MYSIVMVSAGVAEWELFTQRALLTLKHELQGQDYQLIVVDNYGSGRGDVNTDHLLPYAAAVNLGARLATHSKLLILNNDIEVRGNILRMLHDAYSYYAGPVLLRKEGVDYIEGWCISIDTDLWWLLNGFDEGYKNSWEDVDLAYRLSRLYIKPAVVTLPIKHIWGATRDRMPGSNQWDETNRQLLLSRMRDTRHWFGGTHKYEESYITGS